MVSFLILLLSISSAVLCCNAVTTPAVQMDAVRGLIRRVVPEREALFNLEWVSAPPGAYDVWEVRRGVKHSCGLVGTKWAF